MKDPLKTGDKFIRQYEDSTEYGAWVGVFVYEDENGDEYSIRVDQDGGEEIA